VNNDKEAERAEPQKLVFGLLDYIEQVEKLSAKPAFSIPSDAPFVAYQHDFKGLPELQFNLQIEGDDVWLRIPRLQEIAAPDPEDALKPWVTLPKNPEKRPDVKGEIMVSDDNREARLERLEGHPEIPELFDWYVEYQWEPWAKAERLRRKTMAFYNKLFSLHQAISLEGAETTLELVWGIGYSVWKKDGHTALKYPLLMQACEVRLDEQTFDLEVRPRDVEPRLETDCFVEMGVSGVKQLEADWKDTLAKRELTADANRVNPFEAETYENLLKVAAANLDTAGEYEVQASDAAPPAPEGTLKITNTWVLFGRKRSSDIFIDDIRRLKEKVKKAEKLPSVIRRFVEHGDTTVRVNPEQAFRGLSASDSSAGAMELYFPMPYNDEQVSIVQKLYANDGVVVQGHPGTGKTHTIANVICHYLAQGKRVLVTSKGEAALSVLQEKLPKAVRQLSVSLLSDERDGMKQFEHSIQTIAARVAETNPTRVQTNIQEAKTQLNQLHARISNVDQTIATYAANHMRKRTFQGREVTPGEMAKLVLEQTEIHEWFDDEPPSPKDGVLPFNDAEVSALRRARIALGKDLAYLGCKLPAPDDFSVWADLLSLHRDLVKTQTIDDLVVQGKLLALVDSRPETFEKAQSVVQFLSERMALKAKLAAAHLPWLEGVSKRLANMQTQDPRLQALQAVLTDIRKLEHQRRKLVAKAVDVPVDAESNPNYIAAVDRLLSGKSAFGLPFGKADVKKLLAGTTVTGTAPVAQKDWMLVHETLDWRTETRKILARWNSLANDFGLETPNTGLEAGFRNIAQWQATIDDARKLIFDFNAKLHPRLEEVLGQTTVNKMWNGGEPFVATAYTSLQAHIDKERLAYAPKQSQELVRKLDACHGSIVDELRGFFTGSFGQIVADESALQSKWLTLHAELTRLTTLQPYLDEVGRITDAIESACASRWVKRLRSKPASSDLDPVTPASWLDAWNWRRAVMFLDRIDGHHKLRELFEERRTLTGKLARTYQDLVAEKAWLGVFNNSPESVKMALAAYLAAIHAMGKGGKKLAMLRRDARKAMEQAYTAVPCWILPHWRVSETVPSDIGVFDLVVVDEASQSDISCLPAVLRGKKILVVGDDKQVSPSAIGLLIVTIQNLRQRFLQDFPHGALMIPGSSFYDLAQVVFAGNSVMLKEHFRCVPAIIEFSNRVFYNGDITPLRVPKANERLDPPLVDVYVKGGYRKGDVNEPEARAIVNEIKTILDDRTFDKRSIGVVTLLGNDQAKHIHELISDEISPDVVVERKIVVGSPPMFQGRERDIMMVSMVLVPGDHAAANKLEIEQRFNVALSRARDRMYLFRSVSDTEFRADTLNGKLISHFKQPFHSNVQQAQTLRERCESGFEREMFDELVKREFRVRPQVRSSGYRIDFVVEGNEGRRLAIECDGDFFHGPERWKEDMARQRVLERAGWTFWRCFASSFVRRRQKVLDDLWQTLDGLGIQPLGAESLDNTVWVHHKEVDPFGVEETQEVD
jgi:very-short-patch-repair endonuclease